MAKNIEIKLNIDVDKSINGVEQLDNSTNKLSKSLTDAQKAANKEAATIQKLNDVLKTEVKTEQDLINRKNALTGLSKRLDKTTEEGTAQYKKMREEILKLNNELKKSDAAIGNNQRNVGNYPKFSADMVAAYAAIAVAMKVVVDVAKESIKEFLNADKVQQQVNQSFGMYSANITDAANEFEKATTMEAEQFMNLAIAAKAYGASNKDVNDIVNKSIGLSTMFAEQGVSQEEAMKALVKAQQGQYAGLEKIYPALAKVTDETEKMRIVNELAAQGMDKASAYAETWSGKMAAVENSIGNLKEEAGQQLLTGILGTPEGMNGSISAIDKMVDAVNESQSIVKIIEHIKDSAQMVLEPFEKMFKLFDSGADAGDMLTFAIDGLLKILDLTMYAAKLFWGSIEAVVDVFIGLKDIITKIIDGSFEWQDVWNVLNQVIVDLLSPLADIFGLTDELEKFFGIVEESATSVEKLATGLNAVTAAGDKFQSHIEKRTEKIKEDEDAVKAAESAYKSYSEAIFKANEEYKLSIALAKDGDKVKKASLKLAQDTYNAYNTYYANGGYTQFETDKLAELQKIIDDLSFQNFVAPLKVKLTVDSVSEDIFKDVEEQIKNWTPKNIKPTAAVTSAGEENGVSFFDAFINGFKNGTLKENMSDFVANSMGISSEQGKMVVEAGVNTANQVYGAIKEIRNQNMQQEMSELDERYRRELEGAEGNESKKLAIEKRYAAKKAKLEKEQNKKKKTQAIADATINGALAITNIWATSGGVPPLAAALTALSAIVTAAQIAVISKQKFAQGGILQGPLHANGGIKTPMGEFEGGEAIINRRSTATFAPLISRINEVGGGKSLSSSQLIDYDLLASKINDKKVYLVTSDVTVNQKKEEKILMKTKY